MRGRAVVLDFVGATLLWLARYHAELLLSFALLAGWMLVTFGIAELTTARVWPISTGLLLLSLCGWKMLIGLAVDGLYALTRKADAEDSDA